MTTIEDEPGKVYLFGLSRDVPKSVAEETIGIFRDNWTDIVDHAGAVIVPMRIEANVTVEIEGPDELKDFIERRETTRVLVSDRLTDPDNKAKDK